MLLDGAAYSRGWGPVGAAALTLYRLTREARGRFEASGRRVREVAHWLGTSPAQLDRLRDPTNYAKSVRQFISLLYVLGCEVDLRVTEQSRTAWPADCFPTGAGRGTGRPVQDCVTPVLAAVMTRKSKVHISQLFMSIDT